MALFRSPRNWGRLLLAIFLIAWAVVQLLPLLNVSVNIPWNVILAVLALAAGILTLMDR
jgi:uncharacterized membrane protein HdeD (DUF308 family)